MTSEQPGGDVEVAHWDLDVLAGRVVLGAGALSRVPDELERLGADRVLGIASRSAAAALDSLVAQLGPLLVGRIDEVAEHVPVAVAAEARDLARRCQADTLLVVGGGSAIGLAKAVALQQHQPILAVPTTYSGSEQTAVWGLTGEEGKRTGSDLHVKPATVIYDPELYIGLPAQVTAASGMNALAHAVGALCAPDADPVTRSLAIGGIRRLRDALPRAVEAPDDLRARAECCVAAALAGMALAHTGAGLHHKLCHVLGGAYALPHARTHAILLPHTTALLEGADENAGGALREALAAERADEALWQLLGRLGLPTSLVEIGFEREWLDAAVDRCHAGLEAAGIAGGRAEVERILGRALEGTSPLVAPE